MTADTVGGVWTYALEVADALAPRGVEVVLATMGRRPTDEQWRAVRRSAVREVRESEFPLEWMDGCWEGVDRAGEWLLGLERELAPDLVHLNGYVHADLPWRAPTVVVGHSCVLSWWDAVRREPAPPEWDTYRTRVTAGLRAAGTVVAPTRAMLDELVRWYGVAGGVVVPNARAPRSVRRHPKEPLIVSAGRLWDEAKNVAALVEAAPALDWPVAVAGERDHPDGGPPAAVRDALLLGPLAFDDLADWLGRAAVFALPARYEPFGLAALEAGLSGCALVLGDIPSLREVWDDAAVFVDPFDAGAVRAALAALVADPAAVEDLGRRATARARTFGPARMADGYLDVYARLPVGGPR